MTASRLLVAPAALAGEPDPTTLVAARAAAERRWDSEDAADIALVVGMLEGDLASQHAVELELAHEGLDRTLLGREAFVERVRESEARHRDELASALASEGIVKPVLHLGLPDKFIDHGDPGLLLASVGLDAKGIAAAIRERFSAAEPRLVVNNT